MGFLTSLYGLRLLQVFALTFFTLIAKPAFAGNCSYTAQSPTFVSGSPTLSGSVTAGRDVPIGTVLYRATFWSAASFWIHCQAGTYTYEKYYKTTPHAISGLTSPRGGPVYQTSIPGVGVYFWSDGYDLPANVGTFTYGKDTTEALTSGESSISSWLSFDVEIIKIANTVGAGTLRGTDLPTVEFSVNGGNRLVTLSGHLNGAINVVSRTCTTPDVSVDLGTHFTSELKGPNTATEWVNVPIQLNDCPAFFGSNATRVNSDGSTTNYSLSENVIEYNISPAVEKSPNVMGLQPDGVNPTASGIGIQIATANETPIYFKTNSNSGLALNQTDGSNYTIPLLARYYQTGVTTSAGQANGAATVTFIYN